MRKKKQKQAVPFNLKKQTLGDSTMDEFLLTNRFFRLSDIYHYITTDFLRFLSTAMPSLIIATLFQLDYMYTGSSVPTGRSLTHTWFLCQVPGDPSVLFPGGINGEDLVCVSARILPRVFV